MNMPKNWETRNASEVVVYRTENETGQFWCNADGMLTYWNSREEVRLSQPPHGYGGFGDKKRVRTLVIPEGVISIGDMEMFFHKEREDLGQLIVVEKLVLPETLRTLGAHVLSGCLIMELELPASLREIGPGALMCNYIHRLKIPCGLAQPAWYSCNDPKKLKVWGRQFKECLIRTLICPRGYPYNEQMPEAKIEHIIYLDE